MAGRDGFQPCEMDTGTSAPTPRWEKNLVTLSLVVHIIDVGLDLLVALLFLAHYQWGFFLGSTGVITWAWLVSSLYISFGGGRPLRGDIDDGDPGDHIPAMFPNFVQVQIFAEAFRCVFRNGDTDYFHTLRLMEAILESAPNALVQLYALLEWVGADHAPDGAGPLLRFSIFASFVSVGLGLAMWEQKVQFRTSAAYVAAVAVMRSLEIASRSITLAIFAALTHPYGFWWALLIDYGVMLFLIARHQSVQFTYGLFVALPLVLVSLEPLVWRREDHAVPKDSYYMVRILEFLVMWILILRQQDALSRSESSVWMRCEVLAILSTIGLYVTLPFIWCVARKHELSRDVADWGEDSAKEGLHEDGMYSDSELSPGGGSSGSDRDAEDHMPGE